MKTPEEKMTSSLTRVLEFWRDYNDGFSAEKLAEKYEDIIDHHDLMERFVNLYMENQALKRKIETAIKSLR